MLTAAALVAGCGGGGGGAAALPPTGAQTNQQAIAPLAIPFTITIPQTTTSGAKRSPRYVSAATQSAVVQYGSSRQIMNCTQGVCSGTVGVSPGTVTFTVNLMSGQNGTGSVLSTGSTTTTIVAGQNNKISLTFGGVVASVALATNPSSVPAGTSASVPVIVTARDASGETIVGPDPYATPITLSNNDRSGATALSTTSVATPNASVTLNYNGSTTVSSVQLGAAVSGAAISANATLSFIPGQRNPQPVPYQQTSFSKVAAADGAVAIYPMADTGSTLTDVGPNGVNGSQGPAVATGQAGIAYNESHNVKFNGASYDRNAFDFTAPSSALQPANAMSVEFWVKLNGVNNSGTEESVVSYAQNGTSSGGWTMQIRSPYDQLEFRLHLYGSKQVLVALGTTRLAVGQVYHVIGTYNGTQANIYLNGVPEVSSATIATEPIYYPKAPTYGLSIGGERGGTRNQINGTVSDVAVYPQALSASTALQHFVSGVNTAPVTETPVTTGAFVDSIGVNTHFTWINSQWDWGYPQMKSMLAAANIHHIRESLSLLNWTTYYQRLNELGGLGIRSDLVGSADQSASNMLTVASYLPNAIDSFEGLNEPDLTGAGWQQTAVNFQQLLWNTMKTNPSTAMYPILGFSVTAPQAAQSVGNMSGYLDEGNLHNYYSQNNPGTTGGGSYNPLWGYGGSIDSFMQWETILCGSKPIVTTESGYSTDPSSLKSISFGVQAKYVARLLFEQFNHGVKRTYVYELMDEPPQVGQNFNFNGLIDTNFHPKPAYNAIKSITNAIADSSSSFSTTPLSFSLSGDLNNVHHLLMQKSDGTYVLAYWLEVPDWDTQNNVELHPSAQNVSVTLAGNPASASITTLDANGNASTQGASFSNGAVSLSATDQISLLTFHQ